jgi:ribulose-phosphate 3-epimerase
MIKIAPSLLAADFSKLGEEVSAVMQAGADYLHLDVMDGSFVPNITFGQEVIKSLRKSTSLPFDVHLMIQNPELHIESFAKSGADIITIHSEATIHLDRCINLIKSFGKKAGLSLVPSTHENTLDYVLYQLDLVLIMTVNPGFGGQKFLDSQIRKISAVSKKIADLEKKTGRKIELEVDGGINDKTAKMAIDAGANILVAGSYIFQSNSYSQAVSSLKNLSET